MTLGSTMLRLGAALLALAGAASPAAAQSWCVSGGPIPDPGALSRTIQVPPAATPQTIVSARVRLVGTHPWVGDLRVRVVHPTGTIVELLDRPGMPSVGYPGPWGCGGDNLDLWLSDAAANAVETSCPYGAVPALGGTLRPNGSLAALAGRSPVGLWTIVVEDASGIDAGQLSQACLELVLAPDCNANGVPDATDIANGTSGDADSDGVPDECDCAGDLDGDGAIGASDLAALLSRWGACGGCSEDLTGDGTVAADDLALLLSRWGGCAGS
ncbi:MAG: hypothetical protein ACKO0W_09130 [Planctomycetota bacterium]